MDEVMEMKMSGFGRRLGGYKLLHNIPACSGLNGKLIDKNAFELCLNGNFQTAIRPFTE